MSKHQSYYMVIPSEVWDAELTARAMVLYGHISVLANKKKYCYASNKYFEDVMKSSSSSIKRSMKELEDKGFIEREIIYKEDSREIDERKIFLKLGMVTDEPTGMVTDEPTGMVTDDPVNSTSKNKTRRNSKSNVVDVDESKKKLYWAFVERYPKNRVGNRQHTLKNWLQLTPEEMKLAYKNLDRYLKIANGFVKKMSNYLDERCFSEEWLKEEERNKNSKGGKIDSKNFTGNY